MIMTGYIPVAETFGFAAEMRYATAGHAFWQFIFHRWDRTPEKLEIELIKQLRERRGLPKEIPTPEMFVDEV